MSADIVSTPTTTTTNTMSVTFTKRMHTILHRSLRCRQPRQLHSLAEPHSVKAAKWDLPKEKEASKEAPRTENKGSDDDMLSIAAIGLLVVTFGLPLAINGCLQ